MRRWRKLPSPTQVLAIVALVVAVGGGYAVGANKIDTGQIANKAVTNKKIAKKTIKKNRVAPDTLTGAQIREDTLGTVPSAQSADSADTADVAGTARSTFKDTAVQVPGGSGFTPVLTLDVPAGSYLFMSKAVLAKGGVLSAVQCRISAEGVSDRSLAFVDATHNQTIVNNLAHTFDAAGSAVLECDNPDAALLLITNSRLTAIPFASLQNTEAP